jgi:HSP20 family protein
MAPESEARDEKTQQETNRPSAEARSQTEQAERERTIEPVREGSRAATGVGRRGQGTALRGPISGGAISSPFSLLRRMADDMDRIFQDFGFGPTAGTPSALESLFDRDLWRGIPALEQGVWAPQLETFRRGENYVVRADLPGLKKENVNIEVDNDVLTISGERNAEHEEDRAGYYRSERSYGRFLRAIPLPEGVNADQCEASFKDGVLEVTFPAPKSPERRAQRVQIR